MVPKIIEILSRTDSSKHNPAANKQVITNLVEYLDANLIFLRANLVAQNFDRVLSAVWAATSTSISTVINKGIENKKSVSYFANVHDTFHILLNFFFDKNVPQNDTKLECINHLLKLYSCNVSDLVSVYYKRRYMDQRLLSATSTYPIGSITLRALIDRSHLRIELLNSRHLKPSHIQRRQYGEDIEISSSNAGSFCRGHTLRRSYAFGVNSPSAILGAKPDKVTVQINSTDNSFHQNGRNNNLTNGMQILTIT